MPFDYDFQMRIGAPRPIVFERLLRIEHLSRWFCGWSRIEPKVGGSFKFGGETCIILPEGRGWETKIDEGDVLRRFAFTWPIRSSATRVSYELEDGPRDTTVLHVRHRGVPFRSTTCGSVQDAWRMCLGNLKSVVEGRGDSVRPDHSPAHATEVRLSVLIEAGPAKVFDAFVNPGEVAHWSTGGPGESVARVDPHTGGKFSFGAAEGLNQVLEWEASRRIVLESEEKERVQFDLEEKASGTAIYFAASRLAQTDSEQSLQLRGRWSDRLVCLKNLVESGESGFLDAYEDQVLET